MVLALTPARKGQSQTILHNRAWLPGFRLRTFHRVRLLLAANSGLPNEKAPFRSISSCNLFVAAYFASVTCSLFSS
jgi:hypothetical protein